MPKRFFVLLASTLLIGFVCGAYVKFITREPEADAPPPHTMAALEIVATEYGGCERIGCPMYRIIDTGEYTYIRYGLGGAERFSGIIPSNERARLLTLLEQTSLPTLQESMFMGTCPITYDGTAHRFEVRADGVSYEMDSCRENLSNDLFINELIGLFVQLNSAHQPE